MRARAWADLQNTVAAFFLGVAVTLVTVWLATSIQPLATPIPTTLVTPFHASTVVATKDPESDAEGGKESTVVVEHFTQYCPSDNNSAPRRAWRLALRQGPEDWQLGVLKSPTHHLEVGTIVE